MKRSLSILFSFMVVCAFLDGHDGTWAAVKLFDWITVKASSGKTMTARASACAII